MIKEQTVDVKKVGKRINAGVLKTTNSRASFLVKTAELKSSSGKYIIESVQVINLDVRESRKHHYSDWKTKQK